MMRRVAQMLVVVAMLAGAAPVWSPPPTVDDLKRALEASLVRLKPQAFAVRTVLFEDVVSDTSDSTGYRFIATVNVHDYSSGTPANKEYGKTCLRRMDGWTFALKGDSARGWSVEGRLTGADSVCMDNPAEGESSIPLESLISAGPPVEDDAGNLPAGEWHCYDAKAQRIANLTFVLRANGKYTDGDGARGGTFVYSATRSEISFRGGFLSGQIGTDVQSSGFALSETTTCEPKSQVSPAW